MVEHDARQIMARALPAVQRLARGEMTLVAVSALCQDCAAGSVGPLHTCTVAVAFGKAGGDAQKAVIADRSCRPCAELAYRE